MTLFLVDRSTPPSSTVATFPRFCTTPPLLRRIMFAHIPATIWEARRGGRGPVAQNFLW
jgi:hypothetical protein